MTDRTALGDRIKAYEEPSTSRRAFKGQPLVARLDGKSFHTFTKGLKRPYDKRLSDLMVDTMKALVDRFNANIGYVQSDEITLVWLTTPDSTVELPFSGRFQKLESLLAGFCSAYFNKHLDFYLPEKADQVPYFDCRAFVVPTVQEAYHAVLWRQQDCTKNAVSMAAQSMFSHKYLQGRNGAEMQELMWKEKGVNFNDYPAFFKRGTFARRVKEERMLTEEQLAKIPEGRRPTGPVTRSFVDTVDIWLSKQTDPVAALFYGAPIVEAPNPPVPEGEIAKGVRGGTRLKQLMDAFESYDVPDVSGGLTTTVKSYDGWPRINSLEHEGIAFEGSAVVLHEEGADVIYVDAYRFKDGKWQHIESLGEIKK
jgi:tRNA(His) 5'-end guanylyltransferase